MEYKYKTKFDSVASFDIKKWKEVKARKQAFASLEDLRSLLPSDDEIRENPDLLYVSFNAAVVNLINSNDHGITTETALAISKYFVNRHMNVEHCRYDVIGHIISQGFSSFGDNKMLDPQSVPKNLEPFNICLGSIVYKVVREYLAEAIEDSAEEDSEYFGQISTSWEIGFNEFDIALGSKRLADAEIISDPERIKELSKYLKMEGGDGFLPDGTPVYCVIKGDARPLGCAFTGSPAAAVSGVFVVELDDEEEDPEEMEAKKCKKNASSRENESSSSSSSSSASSTSESLNSSSSKPEGLPKEEVENLIAEKVALALQEFAKASENTKNTNKLEENTKNSSQLNKNTVNKNMKLKSTEDITPDFLQTAEASSEIKSFIVQELEKNSQPYVTKVEEITQEKANVETALNGAKQDLANTQKELSELKAKIEAKEAQELFDSRMEEIASVYDLNEGQRTAVATQIKLLDDEAFTAWKTNFDLFAAKKQEEEQKEEKDPTASLKTATASTTTTVPNSSAPETDQLKAIMDSLKKAITVN